VAVTGALMLEGCGLIYRKSTFHFRMHVEVMTPQGPRRGAGVLELISEKTATFAIATSQGGTGLIGEAVVVDLPDGPLFVLLRHPGQADSTSLANMVLDAMAPGFPDENSADTGVDQNRKVARAREGSIQAELPPQRLDPYNKVKQAWPMMVRFEDLANPKSVELVDPQAIGVKRIWVENTSAPLTTGIRKRLPWLGDRGHLLDSDSGPTTRPTLAQTIDHGAFLQRPLR
jgi:hypothetical protein